MRLLDEGETNLRSLSKRLGAPPTKTVAIAVVGGLLFIALAVSVFTRPWDRRESDEATRATAKAGDRNVGGSGSTSSEAKELTEGEFHNPAMSDRDVIAREIEAEKEEQAKEPLAGWHVGYYWVPQSDHVRGHDAPRGDCKNDELQYVDISELKSSPFWFELPKQLPPGAFQHEEAVGVSCKSQIIYIGRDISFQPQGGSAGFSRVVGPTSRLIKARTSSSRVMLSRIAGREVVIMNPLTPEGSGHGAILVRNDAADATLTVASRDFPLPELVKLAKQMIEAGVI